jgi:hypothetical protein
MDRVMMGGVGWFGKRHIPTYLSVDEIQGNDERAPRYQGVIGSRNDQISHEQDKISMVIVSYTVMDPRTYDGLEVNFAPRLNKSPS